MNDNSISRNDANDVRTNIIRSLIIAAAQVGGTLLLTLAHRHGMIEKDTLTRGVSVLIGLGVAAYGNTMPKALGGPPPSSLRLAELRQAIARTGGWAMTLAGLTYAGLWAFAPRQVAFVGGLVAVGAGAAVMLGYTAWRGIKHDRTCASLRASR